MNELTAQLASAKVLHLRGHFEPDAPSRLLDVKGIGHAYLVPHGSGGMRCMVVESMAPISLRRARGIRNLVDTIAGRLGCSSANVILLRAVERRDAGQATSIYDWATLQG